MDVARLWQAKYGSDRYNTNVFSTPESCDFGRREGYSAQGRHSFILPRWVCAPRMGYPDIQARWRQKVLLFSYPNLTFSLVLKIFCLMLLQSDMMLWIFKKNDPNKTFSRLKKTDFQIYLFIDWWIDWLIDFFLLLFYFALLQEDATKITINYKSKTKCRTKNNRNHERWNVRTDQRSW